MPLRIKLIVTPDAEYPTVMLPTPAPTLTVVRELPPPPPPTRHRTVVPDSHSDASQAVPPACTAAVYRPSPMLAPLTVTLPLPVPPPLLRPTPLTRASVAECPSVKLPTLCPTLTTALKLPLIPRPRRHSETVSDNHAVASHLVVPPLPSPLWLCTPSPLPKTVTLPAPVAPTLL